MSDRLATEMLAAKAEVAAALDALHDGREQWSTTKLRAALERLDVADAWVLRLRRETVAYAAQVLGGEIAA